MRKDDPLSKVIAYYEATREDYEKAWFDPSNYAVHFGFYDERARRHAQALNNTNRVMAEAAGITAADRILDAGCGRGGSCFWLAANCRAHATGISPVPGQIRDCRDTAARLELTERTTFLEADYTATPFPDRSFTVVWACESVCHAPEKSAFYREAFRLLQPGGRLIIAEYLRSGRPLNARGERQLARWLENWAIPDLDTPTEHLHHLQEAGFVQSQFRNVTPQVRVSLRNLSKKSAQWRAYSKLLVLLDLRSRLQHGNLLGGIYQYRALRSGCWTYQLITAHKPG